MKIQKLIRSPIVVCVFYIFLIGILFGIKAFDTSLLLVGDDIHRQYWFMRSYFRDSILSGVFPWWNPYTFSGAPFAANVITNPWYPPNWLYVFFPLSLAYIIHIGFHLVFSMMGMYVLVKNLVGKRVPSIVVGVVYGFSGFFMARLFAGHVDVIAACSWIPWVFFAFYRLFRTYSFTSLVFTAVILACQIFSGYQTMAFFSLEGVGIMMVFFCIKKRSIQPLLSIVGSISIALGLSACAMLPIQQFVSLSIRTFERTYDWVSFGALPLSSLKQFLFPFQYGNHLIYAGPRPNFAEQAYFVGRVSVVVIVMLCIQSIVSLFPRKSLKKGQKTVPPIFLVLLFFLILFFGLWVSMASYAPIDLQKISWNLLPMYKVLRIPTRHLILVSFSASVLVGLGLSTIKEKWIKLILSFAIVVEMMWYGSQFISYEQTPDRRNDASVISLFQSEKELTRILPNYGCWLPPRDAYDFEAPLRDGVYSVTGYDPTIYRPYYEFIDAANGAVMPSIYEHDVQVPYLDIKKTTTDFLNVKYLMLPSYADPLEGKSDERYTLVKEDSVKQYRIYENTAVLPRFYVVPNAIFFSSQAEATEKIREGIDYTSEVVIVDPTRKIQPSLSLGSACGENSEYSLRVDSYTQNRIELSVDTSCDQYFVSSEVMYPGWKATIDGKKTQLLTGNLAFRTLFVPKGKHSITMVFQPIIFVIGWGISFLTLALIILYWIVRKNKKQITRI